LADYLVPTNADIPNPEVIAVEDDDQRVNPAGVRGMGEVAMCGSAAAVANAVYHATGIRVRELPITVEALL
jgi:xanthine dehydrogenase YagR molybdenum-binding subunit